MSLARVVYAASWRFVQVVVLAILDDDFDIFVIDVFEVIPAFKYGVCLSADFGDKTLLQCSVWSCPVLVDT